MQMDVSICIVWVSRSWALTPSTCPWVPVSPVSGTWTYEPPRLWLHSSCWDRCSDTHLQHHTHPHTTHCWASLLELGLATQLMQKLLWVTTLPFLPLHSQRHTHQCPPTPESPSPRKRDRERFSKGTGQISLMGCRTQPDE